MQSIFKKKSIFRIFDIVESNEDNIQKLFISILHDLYQIFDNFIKFKQHFVVVRVDFNLVQIALGYYF